MSRPLCDAFKQLTLMCHMPVVQDQHAQAVQSLLAKQEEGEAARQQQAAAALADLQRQNELLQQQTARQEALLDQQQGQFAECHTAIQQATDVSLFA